MHSWRPPVPVRTLAWNIAARPAIAPAAFSPPGSRQRMHPAVHARLGVLDVLLGEEVLRSHLVDRIDRAQEVALVAERHCRIDAHAAFELGVRRGPLLLACGHAL